MIKLKGFNNEVDSKIRNKVILQLLNKHTTGVKFEAVPNMHSQCNITLDGAHTRVGALDFTSEGINLYILERVAFFTDKTITMSSTFIPDIIVATEFLNHLEDSIEAVMVALNNSMTITYE